MIVDTKSLLRRLSTATSSTQRQWQELDEQEYTESKNSPLPPLPPPAMAQTQAPPPSYHDSVLLRQQQSLPSLPPAPPLPPRSQTLPRVRSPVAPPPPARNARTVGYQYAGATPSNIDMGPSFPSTPVMIEHGHGNRLPAAAYAKDLPLLECAPGKHDYVTKYGLCGVVTTILLFPIGAVALLFDRKRRCQRCGHVFQV